MKILFAGGGTGGHIMPILAVVSEIKKEKNGGEMEFMCLTSEGNVNRNFSKNGITVKTIKAGKLRRYFSLSNFADVFLVVVGIVQSLFYIWKFKPNVVFSKGGFASVPPAIAAWILKVPVLTHESDIRAGLANKIISIFSKEIMISFSETGKYFLGKNVVLTGNPVRSDILKSNKKDSLDFFRLSGEKPVILIFGGSQGSERINNAVLEIMPVLLRKYQIIHLCGKNNYQRIRKYSEKLENEIRNNYRLYPFLEEEMKYAYAVCDIVVSRAGANSLFEIFSLGKPSIAIPLSGAAADHQQENAEFFEKKGFLVLLKEFDLTPEKLIENIENLFSRNGKRFEIEKNLRNYNESKKGSAARAVADEILKYAKH